MMYEGTPGSPDELMNPVIGSRGWRVDKPNSVFFRNRKEAAISLGDLPIPSFVRRLSGQLCFRPRTENGIYVVLHQEGLVM